jgi:hypothetical protein
MFEIQLKNKILYLLFWGNLFDLVVSMALPSGFKQKEIADMTKSIIFVLALFLWGLK